METITLHSAQQPTHIGRSVDFPKGGRRNSMHPWVKRGLLVLLVVSLGSVWCFSQEITGRVAGVVTDPTNARIPGVEVKVEGPTLFAPRTVITGEDATYLVDKLPPGDYKVTIS